MFPTPALAKKVRRKYPQFKATYEKWEAETITSSAIDGSDVMNRIGAASTSPEASSSPPTALFGALIFLGEGVQSGVTDFRPIRKIANYLASSLHQAIHDDEECRDVQTLIVAGKVCFHSERPFTIVELIAKPRSSSCSVDGTSLDNAKDSEEDAFSKCLVADCFSLMPPVVAVALKKEKQEGEDASGAQPATTTASTECAPQTSPSDHLEWVVASQKGEGNADAADFYVVRLVVCAREEQQKKGGEEGIACLLPAAASTMQAADVAKLIANCDGVPFVPTPKGATRESVVAAVREETMVKEERQTVALLSVEPSARDAAGAKFLEVIPIADVPGLFAVPDFLSKEEEQRILEELAPYQTQGGEGAVSSNASAAVAAVNTPWEQLARRDVLHFSRRFFYDTMKVGAVGEQVSGPNPLFYKGLCERLCTGVRKPLWPVNPSSSKRPREEEEGESPAQRQDEYIASDDANVQAPGWPVPLDHFCDQLTVNRYRYNQKTKVSSGIAQHVDVHSFFGDIVFAVSLASHTLLEYERPLLNNKEVITRRVPIFAAPRALVIMTGESRFLWTHAIQHKYADVVDESVPAIQRRDRVSLTLRKARNDPETEHNLSNCPYPFMCDSKM